MENPLESVLTYFDALNEIPRCSKNEAAVAKWLAQWADARSHDYRRDDIGNLAIRIPARQCAQGPTVVIQGHMDMVCEKTPESQHDFTRDPIRSFRRDDWLMAEGTTLGADNGIAIAYALTLADDAGLVHPPLELLFTVDEESGLSGAMKMDAGLISGKILINLDSEDEGCFTIGCAGGIDTRIMADFPARDLKPGLRMARLTVGGLHGGHSGVDINKHRGNANRIMGRILAALRKEAGFTLVSLAGGSQHNAIPRDCCAVIAHNPADSAVVHETCARTQRTIKQEMAGVENKFYLTLAEIDQEAGKALSAEDTDRTLWLLLALPNGVAGMSLEMQELVETSSNLATVSLHDGVLRFLVSHRSARMSRLDEITSTTHAVADLAGLKAENISAYPPWQPAVDSPLLVRAQNVYQKLFSAAPRVQVMHAGLECAIIGDLCGGMDMISLGPTIRYPHSPHEQLHIPSVGRVWQFLTALLEDLGKEGR